MSFYYRMNGRSKLNELLWNQNVKGYQQLCEKVISQKLQRPLSETIHLTRKKQEAMNIV